jgi:hypothetical protein
LQLANGIDVLLAALGFLDGIFVIDFGTAISKIWECSKMLNYSDVEQLQSTEPLPPFPSPQSQIQGLCTRCSLKVNSVVGKNLDMMVVNGAAPIIGCTCVDCDPGHCLDSSFCQTRCCFSQFITDQL